MRQTQLYSLLALNMLYSRPSITITHRPTEAEGLWDEIQAPVCVVRRSPTVICPEHSSLSPDESHICHVTHSSC